MPNTTRISLTREVRFGINAWDDPSNLPATNGFAGKPPLTGLGHYFELQVTLLGPIDARSSYLRNIKEIDDRVRALAVPAVRSAIDQGSFRAGGQVIQALARTLDDAWPGSTLASLRLFLSPYLSLGWHKDTPNMITLHQRFEFSAAHRLHSPQLSDEQNIQTFGKCNNPHGHGHNYEFEVELHGTPDASGCLIPVLQLEQLVDQHVVNHLDHKHLNVEVPEFQKLNPSVENIAAVIFDRLRDVLRFDHAKLAAVTVWETPKTWARCAADQ